MLLLEGGPLLLELGERDPVLGLAHPQLLQPHAGSGDADLLSGAQQVQRLGVAVLQRGQHHRLDARGPGRRAGVACSISVA